MWLRNNSKREWLQYNCGGGVMVDVLPNSDFKVSDKAGALLLKNLGCSAWIQEIPDPRVTETTPEQTIIPPQDEEEKTPGIIERIFKKQFCTQCDSKGKRHKKECPTNLKKDEIDLAGVQEEPKTGEANASIPA